MTIDRISLSSEEEAHCSDCFNDSNEYNPNVVAFVDDMVFLCTACLFRRVALFIGKRKV